MKLIHRIGYFSVGLFFGIIILIFFLSGKKASCDYSPNERVLKNIRQKERDFSEEAKLFFETHHIDTAQVSRILETGNVDFSRSNTNGDPCNTYLISGEIEPGIVELQFQNCDSLATVQEARMAE